MIKSFTNWCRRGGSEQCWTCGDEIADGVTAYGPAETDHVNCSRECALKDADDAAEVERERAKAKGGREVKQGIGYTFVRLKRRCPRCLRTLDQRATRANGSITIACVGCGHEWRGRFKREEWENEK